LRKQIPGRSPISWHHHPADLLIRVLCHENAFDEAWAAVGEHGASAGVREFLARATEATHPRQAIEVYAERIDRLVTLGENANCAEAVGLLAHMAALRPVNAQLEHIEALKERFGRKRNFMKLLG
jgi:hypothetical protein